MTHIALIAGDYKPEHCGVAHYTHHLRHQLYLHNINSTVLTTYPIAQQTSEPDVVGVVKNWYLSQLIPLAQAIRQTKADILHIQHAAGTYGFNRALFLLPLVLKLMGDRTPIVTTVHEYGWWEWHPTWIPPGVLEWLKNWGQQHHWWDREDGFLLTGSDAIIATNSDAMQVMHSRLPLLAPIYPIPIGINIPVLPTDRRLVQQELRQTWGWANDTVVFVFFGFLHPVKGIETLLSAFKQVVTTHSQARLLLMGGVESLALPAEQAQQYWQKLEGAIANHTLVETVRMTGFLDEVMASRWLSGADIGVLPFNHGVTLKSGSLLALMAHSLPVVATYSPTSKSTIARELALFVAPRQVDALATAMTRLIDDVTLRQQLGLAGQRFSQEFSWQSIAMEHVKIYQALVAGRTRALLKSGMS